MGAWLAVDPRNLDQLVGLVVNREWEPATTGLIMRNIKREGSFVNVGTSYGYYAALLPVLGGPISKTYCFEANPYMIPYLLKTCYWTGVVDQVQIFNRAVSDASESEITISFMRQFAGGGNASAESKTLKFATTSDTDWTPYNLKYLENEQGIINPRIALYNDYQVKTVVIDDKVPSMKKIDLMKIDIEGMESRAILGAKNTIKNSKSIIIILENSRDTYKNASLDDQTKMREAWDFLSEERFDCFAIIPAQKYEKEVGLRKISSWSEWIDVDHGDFIFSREKFNL